MEQYSEKLKGFSNKNWENRTVQGEVEGFKQEEPGVYRTEQWLKELNKQ